MTAGNSGAAADMSYRSFLACCVTLFCRQATEGDTDMCLQCVAVTSDSSKFTFFDKRRAFIKPETQGGQKGRVPEERGEIAATLHVSSVGFREYACLQTERYFIQSLQ